ncbi:unnamed protein product [Allacma fusca]|uniref:Uncharacterized protein n=1 Tax=Allacma fusca TaxID=39272 RepID=A0A8J2JME3_9HEXA|nr:unnamed protein product [Allacma fusca]
MGMEPLLEEKKVWERELEWTGNPVELFLEEHDCNNIIGSGIFFPVQGRTTAMRDPPMPNSNKDMNSQWLSAQELHGRMTRGMATTNVRKGSVPGSG